MCEQSRQIQALPEPRRLWKISIFFPRSFTSRIISWSSWDISGAWRKVFLRETRVMILSELIFYKFYKSSNVLMIVVDRSISEKCDFIEVTELAEYITSNSFRSDSLLVLCPLILECIDDIIDFLRIVFSFYECFHHRIHDFCAVVWFTLSWWFCHHEWDEFETFESGESGTTLLTFSTSTDCLSIFGCTWVDHLCIKILTFRTFHTERK